MNSYSGAKQIIARIGAWIAPVLIRRRLLFAYLLACYAFWILGLPFWWKTVQGFNGLEQSLFMGVFAFSPLTVPFALLLTTFVAPLNGETVAVLLVWGLAAASFVCSIVAMNVLIGFLQKKGYIQPGTAAASGQPPALRPPVQDR